MRFENLHEYKVYVPKPYTGTPPLEHDLVATVSSAGEMVMPEMMKKCDSEFSWRLINQTTIQAQSRVTVFEINPEIGKHLDAQLEHIRESRFLEENVATGITREEYERKMAAEKVERNSSQARNERFLEDGLSPSYFTQKSEHVIVDMPEYMRGKTFMVLPENVPGAVLGTKRFFFIQQSEVQLNEDISIHPAHKISKRMGIAFMNDQGATIPLDEANENASGLEGLLGAIKHLEHSCRSLIGNDVIAGTTCCDYLHYRCDKCGTEVNPHGDVE